jgi:hypothetical protein
MVDHVKDTIRLFYNLSYHAAELSPIPYHSTPSSEEDPLSVANNVSKLAAS